MLLALGDYWQPDRDERSGIGELVHRAKDKRDPGAASELAERFASLATALPEAADRSAPSGGAGAVGGRCLAGDGDRPDLAARCSRRRWPPPERGECRPSLVVKSNPTPRMRHLEPDRRAEVVASAGYRACEPVAGRHIVVVDDVVLTGTTLGAVTACLREAGAASVTAVAAARTRLR